jgi:hypothetical protein
MILENKLTAHKMFLSKIHLDFPFDTSLHFSLLDCSTDFLLLLMKISEFSNFFHFDFLYGMSGPASIFRFWLASFGVNNWLLCISENWVYCVIKLVQELVRAKCVHQRSALRWPLFCMLILFLFFLPPLFKTTEGVVVGFQIFAWAPKKKW